MANHIGLIAKDEMLQALKDPGLSYAQAAERVRVAVEEALRGHLMNQAGQSSGEKALDWQ